MREKGNGKQTTKQLQRESFTTLNTQSPKKKRKRELS